MYSCYQGKIAHAVLVFSHFFDAAHTNSNCSNCAERSFIIGCPNGKHFRKRVSGPRLFRCLGSSLLSQHINHSSILCYFDLACRLFWRTTMESSTCYKIPTVGALISRPSWQTACPSSSGEAVLGQVYGRRVWCTELLVS